MTPERKLFLIAVIVGIAACVRGDDCDRLNEYTVSITKESDFEFVKELKAKSEELMVKIDRPARWLNESNIFRSPVCKQEEVMDLMQKFNIESFSILPPPISMRRSLASSVDKVDATFSLPAEQFDFDVITRRYLSNLEIEIYLSKVAEFISMNNPKIDAIVKDEGVTFEKRAIKSITIAYRGKSNPIVVIDAGVHAREWHARSLALYSIKKLMDEALLDENGLIFKTSFIIMPNTNPDGYSFSRNVDTMWRKNRRPVSDKCIGVDGNRNYDIHWEDGVDEKDPCNEVYKGNAPFSELESQTVRKVLTNVKSSCILYISIHTFGNSILFPNGWTNEKHARFDQLMQVAKAGANAASSLNGSPFKADQSGSGLYISAGGSDDWAIDTLDIPFCYTFEIGAENFGFQVPENELKQTVDEGWAAIRAMTNEALSLMRYK